jgi:hypothetical protein
MHLAMLREIPCTRPEHGLANGVEVDRCDRAEARHVDVVEKNCSASYLPSRFKCSFVL